MAFLFQPEARAYNDESIESYMIRVVKENFFTSYRQLAFALKEEIRILDAEAYGTFPIDLKLLNIWHAKQDSLLRVRAFELMENLLQIPKYELTKIALFRSDKRLLSSKTMLYRANTDIPLSFIRYSGKHCFSIPVCPKCLKERPYIRQIWHLKPYTVCAYHKQDLLENCPQCNAPINYISNELITHCSCGFDFRTVSIDLTSPKNYSLSAALLGQEVLVNNDLLSDIDLSAKLAAIAWYQNRKRSEDIDSEKIINYFQNWPECLLTELNELKSHAKMRQVNDFNKTAFSSAFGQLVTDSFNLSRNKAEPHFITKFVCNFLYELVDENPKTKEPNVADMLLTISEASAILSTSYEQIYRLYETGILKLAIRQKIHHKLLSSDAVFYLRQIIELKKSYGSYPQGMFVSKW